MFGSKNRRILIVDDNPSIHEDFRKVLGGTSRDASLEAQEVFLFGARQVATAMEGFDLESAFNGEEGVDRVHQSQLKGHPYAVAFVDLRMPPGMDGIEMIESVWTLDPDIQFIICSAYSDYSAQEILTRLGLSDRLLMLRKPCDGAEILLLATALCEKWNLAHTAKAIR